MSQDGLGRLIRCVALVGCLMILALSGTPQRVQAISGTVTNCSVLNDQNATEADTLGELLPGGGNILFDCDGVITLPAGQEIEITVVTTLNANGNTVAIQGNGNRVFHVFGGASLTLNGVMVTGGNVTGRGGGILIEVNGAVTLQNGAAVSGNMSTMNGGGIANDGTLTVNNSTFSSNISGNDGGGIHSAGTLTINNSTFSGNAAYLGGGILAGIGTVNITQTTFTNNQTSGLAGGGGLMSVSATVTMTNCTISNNMADGAGGGLFNGQGSMTLNFVALTDNAAFNGGGIWNGGTLIVNNSTLSRNTAENQGGGIYNSGGSVSVTNLTIIGGEVPTDANTAQQGGGIYNLNSGTVSLETGSVVAHNTAQAGGGIFNEAGTVTVNGSTVNNNIASAGNGGGINNQPSGTVNLQAGTGIIGNTANGYGAGVVNMGGTLNITGTTFSTNSAVNDGGGINSAGSLTVSGSTFSGNAAYLGGGILIADGTATITNSTFTGNATSGFAGGAGISLNSTVTATVTGCTFTNNAADGAGGGLFNGGTLTVTNSTVSGSTAYNGAGIYNGGTLKLINSTITGSTAINEGGGIYNPIGTVTVINSTLVGNGAASGGGIHGSGATVRNSIVANSSSGGNCVGSVVNGGNNLSSDGTCGFSLLNTDPKLGPLANNGGQTETHLPAWDSPAIDAGNNTVCANTTTVNNLDQRGQVRPFDGNSDGVATCDMGSVERRVVPPTLAINNSVGFESNTTAVTFTVTRTGLTNLVSSVDYTTVNGTATAGSDYIAEDGTLTFAAGDMSETIVVSLRGDNVAENNETFFVNLSSPDNAFIKDNQGQVTIRNSTVTLSAPANNTYSSDNTPTFTWNAVNTATQYRLQVANNTGFTNPAIDQTVGATSYTPSNALNDGIYYWRMQASDAAGNWSGWSMRWAITIDTQAPARPVLVSPANGSSTGDSTPTLSWQAVNGALRYTLQVDDNVDFSSPIINRTLTATSYTQPSVLADKRYYWHIQAEDRAGNVSAWSARWSFIVNAAPLARPTATSTPTTVFTATPTATATATVSPTATLVPTDQPTATPIPTDTLIPTETPTSTPVPTETPTGVPTSTPTPTETPTEVPTATPTETPTETPTPSETPTEEALPPVETTEEPAS